MLFLPDTITRFTKKVGLVMSFCVSTLW